MLYRPVLQFLFDLTRPIIFYRTG